jgi:hypothetical protein
MRTYGRVTDEYDNKKWVVVTTDANGFNDNVYLTTLIQVLKLNLGESPFFGNYGIPARPSVVQQVFPDYYVQTTQQQFAQYFASLIVAKVSAPTPIYNINVVTHYGALPEITVPV